MNQPNPAADLDVLRSYHAMRTTPPTREALMASAKDWTTLAKARAATSLMSGSTDGENLVYILGCLNHVLRILDEVKP